MRGIILFQSKYGATKKYTDWLIKATDFDCVETKKADIKKVMDYDTIILGGGIYASGIAGLSFLQKNYDKLQSKKMVIFCVGASPYDEKAIKQMRAHNLKENLRDIPCFYCRGAWDEDSMTFVDRTLCKLLHKSLSKKDPSTYEPWMTSLMSAFGQKCDWVDRAYIEPILKELGIDMEGRAE